MPATIDPITLAVLRGALDQISEEMDTVLSSCAISPVIADAWDRASAQKRGEGRIPKAAAQVLSAVANVLNIAWIEDALLHPARIICPRSSRCPRAERCEGARPSRAREIADVKDEILGR